MTAWNTFHAPVELYLVLPCGVSPLRYNDSLKYILYPWELCLTLSPVDLSKRDNFSRKYIPYPCGTVFYILPSGVFSKI